MSRKKQNRTMFSWIFPEITILAHLYNIEWYNGIIQNYSGNGAATLDFVRHILNKANLNYKIQDALFLESYLLSIVSGLEPYLEGTSLSYFNQKINVMFNDIIVDSRRGYIILFDKEKVPTQDVLNTLSERIEIMVLKAVQNFKEALMDQDFMVFNIGRNVIIEYNNVDKCTIIETLVQCSKINGIQFLPHII